jgi:hypothetical protein
VQVRAYQVPSMVSTRNVFEVISALPGAGLASVISVPNLALSMRWDVPESQKASVNVELVSGAGAVVGRYAWNEQPAEGIPVGGVSQILINNGTGSFRADFFLGV